MGGDALISEERHNSPGGWEERKWEQTRRSLQVDMTDFFGLFFFFGMKTCSARQNH